MSERVGIAGSGAIACGLAAVAAQRGDVVVWARSDGSAEKADRRVRTLCEKAGVNVNGNVRVTCDTAELGDASFVVEAIVEDPAAKRELMSELGGSLADEAILATTTSSLSIAELAEASGRPDRFVGLHVFNPVPKMDLVELAFPRGRQRARRASARGRCARRWARPRSRCPTPPASWSTACCSRTCSRPSA